VRLPFRPSLDFVDVAAVAIEWDEGPWENLRGFGARWSGTHLRALASDASVAADVQ